MKERNKKIKKTGYQKEENTREKEPAIWEYLVYFDRNDPRIIVPKKNKTMGWTLNFANPFSYLILSIIVVIIVLSSHLK